MWVSGAAALDDTQLGDPRVGVEVLARASARAPVAIGWPVRETNWA